MNLLHEMLRVCRTATVIITSGTPDKRLKFFKETCAVKIEHHKIEVSKLASLINILRSELKDKPLSHAIKNDPAVLKKALQEMAYLERVKQLTEAAKTDPRQKFQLLMIKAARLQK